VPQQVRPDDFFLRDVQGRPIDGGRFYNTFIHAQRALGISPIRDFYSTKDTYISYCMSNRVDLSWLSDQTGVSEWTTEKHYGRFMHHPDRDALELAKIKPPSQLNAASASPTATAERRAAERTMTSPPKTAAREK
jgi:hypothetical protein